KLANLFYRTFLNFVDYGIVNQDRNIAKHTGHDEMRKGTDKTDLSFVAIVQCPVGSISVWNVFGELIQFQECFVGEENHAIIICPTVVQPPKSLYRGVVSKIFYFIQSGLIAFGTPFIHVISTYGTHGDIDPVDKPGSSFGSGSIYP